MSNYVYAPVHLPEFGERETNCKFNKPTRNRKYIKILALCLVPTPSKLIYRGVKNPIQKQLRDMCRAGLLARYINKTDNKYYYKTTHKGQDLLMKIY